MPLEVYPIVNFKVRLLVKVTQAELDSQRLSKNDHYVYLGKQMKLSYFSDEIDLFFFVQPGSYLGWRGP